MLCERWKPSSPKLDLVSHDQCQKNKKNQNQIPIKKAFSFLKNAAVIKMYCFPNRSVQSNSLVNKVFCSLHRIARSAEAFYFIFLCFKLIDFFLKRSSRFTEILSCKSRQFLHIPLDTHSAATARLKSHIRVAFCYS